MIIKFKAYFMLKNWNAWNYVRVEIANILRVCTQMALHKIWNLEVFFLLKYTQREMRILIYEKIISPP
jgi:hypothetical protein